MTIQDAIRNGDLMEVRKLLEDDPKLVHAKDKFDSTPLHIAVEEGNKSMVEVLLANNADINAKGYAWRTPLHIAASNGQKDIVKILLANNANVFARTNDWKTPLSLAENQNHKEVAEILQTDLKKIIPLRSDLMESVQGGNVKKVKQLLEEHPGLATVCEDDEKTPLHLAAEKGHKNVVKVLLTHKAQIDAKDFQRKTPLYLAAEEGHKDVVEVLLENNADVNAKGSDGRTPLHKAAFRGHADVVKVLLANNADINARDNWTGYTPLHYAAEEGHKDVVEALLENNANFDAKAKDGKTPLDCAVTMNKTVVANLLMQHIKATKSFIKVDDYFVQMEENDIPARSQIVLENIENLRLKIDSEGNFNVVFNEDFSGFTESLNNMSKLHFHNNYSIEDTYNCLNLHDLRTKEEQQLYLEILKMATRCAYKAYGEARSHFEDLKKLKHMQEGVRFFVKLYILYLINTLNHNSAVLRGKAAFELGKIKWQNEPPIGQLSDALQDEYAEVRSKAATALGEINDPRAIEPLTDAVLHDEDTEVRSKATTALGKINDPRAIELLTDALQDEDPDIRSKAAAALEGIKGENSYQKAIRQQKCYKKRWWEFWK